MVHKNIRIIVPTEGFGERIVATWVDQDYTVVDEKHQIDINSVIGILLTFDSISVQEGQFDRLATIFQSRDIKEGLTSFVEKKPNWQAQ